MKPRFIVSGLLLASIMALCLFAAVLRQGSSKASAQTPGETANTILEMAGIQGGLIVHINCGDGTLTQALRINDRYIVHGLDLSQDNVQKSRQYIVSQGNYGPISVDRLNGDRLPYKDNMANVIVSEDLGAVSMDEVTRVLAPNGVAVIKGLLGWNKTVKPRPAELDEWNQYMHDAQGTMVSHDQVIGPVKNYQWIGSPPWVRTHEATAGLSSLVSANGRIFYIIDEGPMESIQVPAENYLMARDAYSGAILWKLPIAEWQNHLFPVKCGPAYTPRRLLAIGDRVYVTMGIDAALSELDAITGQTLRTFPNTQETSEVIYDGGVLFLSIGRPERDKNAYAPKLTYVWDNADWARDEWKWGQQKAQIMAIRVSDGQALWTKSDAVAPLSLTADSNYVYYFNGSNVICVHRATGSQIWKSASITTQAVSTAYLPRLIVYKDVLLFSNNSRRNLLAFSVSNGTKLWEASQPASSHFAPEDMFVINDLVWTGATANINSSGDFSGRDIHTGEVKDQIPGYTGIYWWHQRCYPSRATDKYLLPSRTGIEFVDLLLKNWTVNHYTRGGCVYGIMPSNGLIYTPPNACACYQEAKLNGFGALAPASATDPDLPAEEAKNRLEQGPAYNTLVDDSAGVEDWPTFRHDAKRSSYTTTSISSNVQSQWQINLGGKLSSPVIAGSRVYVAKIDAHTVYAIDAANGSVLWNYIAGGRVDSPPTIYQGRVLFGSADGYVYCLNAANGMLIWRFRAAPMDRRMIAYEQVESVWPVHGSVLIQNDTLYCIAGRSMFMDGGMRLVLLNPRTGQMLSQTVLNEFDDSGKNLQTYVADGSGRGLPALSMPVALPDVLSGDGKYVYMRSQQFDLAGKRKQIAARNVGDQTGEGAHVFSPFGFLDQPQFMRAYMMYGKSVAGGWGSWESMARLTPSGKLIAVDGQKVYGYVQKPEFLSECIIQEFELYAASKSSSQQAIDRVNVPWTGSHLKENGDWHLRQSLPLADQTALDFKWRMDKPDIQVQALVLADKTLFVAGPPHIVDEEDNFFQLNDAYVQQQLAEQGNLLKGKEGGWLWAVSADSGEKLTEYKLESLPVWDGLAAAGGKLYMTTLTGKLACLGESARKPANHKPLPVKPKPGYPRSFKGAKIH
jgi:outer membrane protein assembly factor BamB